MLHHEGTDLRQMLSRAGGAENATAPPMYALDSPQKLEIAVGIARAVAFIHGEGWAHLDIKPENLIVNVSDTGIRVRVADFGFAESPPAAGLTKRVGSPGFIAPEIRTCLEAEGYDGRRADMWSVGATMTELFLGSDRFDALFLSSCPYRGTEDSQEIVRQTLKALRAVKGEVCTRHDGPSADGGDLTSPQNAASTAWETCSRRVFRRLMVLNPATRWGAQLFLECVETAAREGLHES